MDENKMLQDEWIGAHRKHIISYLVHQLCQHAGVPKTKVREISDKIINLLFEEHDES